VYFLVHGEPLGGERRKGDTTSSVTASSVRA
jgi:hypothetical protein